MEEMKEHQVKLKVLSEEQMEMLYNILFKIEGLAISSGQVKSTSIARATRDAMMILEGRDDIYGWC